MKWLTNYLKYAWSEMKAGWQEAEDDRAVGKKSKWDSIPDTFNMFQELCIIGLIKINAPKLVIACVIVSNIFWYYFALLAFVSGVVYFLFSGAVAAFKFIF